MAFLCILSSVLILISAGYLIPKVGDRVCSDRRACPHLRGTMVSFIPIRPIGTRWTIL